MEALAAVSDGSVQGVRFVVSVLQGEDCERCTQSIRRCSHGSTAHGSTPAVFCTTVPLMAPPTDFAAAIVRSWLSRDGRRLQVRVCARVSEHSFHVCAAVLD